MKIAEPILRALAEPVVVLDGELRAVLANSAFYEALRIAPGELEGKLIQDLVPGENGQQPLWTISETAMVHDIGLEDVEFVCVIPPGMRKVMKISARRLSGDEQLHGLMLVEFRDITAETEAERRINELNEALLRHGLDLEKINSDLEAFTHSVSHDLRTPLRLTNSIAHLLLQEHADNIPAGALKKIHMIVDSTRQMGKLIEDLLSFSRVSQEPLRKRRVDTRRLAREALAELRNSQQGREADVTIEELPPCQADRALLKQVFLNLLANSLKFTQPVGHAEIRVGFNETGGETVYYVRDNGMGFDMGHSESIFLPFNRLHKTHDFEGSGIGLSLVRRIIERHGGRVWAEGETGHGATIHFSLDRHSAH